MRWEKIPLYSRAVTDEALSVAIVEKVSGMNNVRLDQILAAGKLAIMGVNQEGHYVLVTGKTTVNGEPTYTINDPLLGATTLFDAYDDVYSSFRVLSQVSSPPGMLSVSGHSPIELLITDPLGRRIGYDPATGTILNEIPNADYFMETLAPNGGSGQGGNALQSKNLVLYTPEEGAYTIQVSGTGIGPYQVLSTALTQEWEVSEAITSGEASAGSLDIIQISYSASTGVGTAGAVYLPFVLR